MEIYGVVRRLFWRCLLTALDKLHANFTCAVFCAFHNVKRKSHSYKVQKQICDTKNEPIFPHRN